MSKDQVSLVYRDIYGKQVSYGISCSRNKLIAFSHLGAGQLKPNQQQNYLPDESKKRGGYRMRRDLTICGADRPSATQAVLMVPRAINVDYLSVIIRTLEATDIETYLHKPVVSLSGVQAANVSHGLASNLTSMVQLLKVCNSLKIKAPILDRGLRGEVCRYMRVNVMTVEEFKIIMSELQDDHNITHLAISEVIRKMKDRVVVDFCDGAKEYPEICYWACTNGWSEKIRREELDMDMKPRPLPDLASGGGLDEQQMVLYDQHERLSAVHDSSLDDFERAEALAATADSFLPQTQATTYFAEVMSGKAQGNAAAIFRCLVRFGWVATVWIFDAIVDLTD